GMIHHFECRTELFAYIIFLDEIILYHEMIFQEAKSLREVLRPRDRILHDPVSGSAFWQVLKLRVPRQFQPCGKVFINKTCFDVLVDVNVTIEEILPETNSQRAEVELTRDQVFEYFAIL